MDIYVSFAFGCDTLIILLKEETRNWEIGRDIEGIKKVNQESNIEQTARIYTDNSADCNYFFPPIELLPARARRMGMKRWV